MLPFQRRNTEICINRKSDMYLQFPLQMYFEVLPGDINSPYLQGDYQYSPRNVYISFVDVVGNNLHKYVKAVSGSYNLLKTDHKGKIISYIFCIEFRSDYTDYKIKDFIAQKLSELDVVETSCYEIYGKFDKYKYNKYFILQMSGEIILPCNITDKYVLNILKLYIIDHFTNGYVGHVECNYIDFLNDTININLDQFIYYPIHVFNERLNGNPNVVNVLPTKLIKFDVDKKYMLNYFIGFIQKRILRPMLRCILNDKKYMYLFDFANEFESFCRQIEQCKYILTLDISYLRQRIFCLIAIELSRNPNYKTEMKYLMNFFDVKIHENTILYCPRRCPYKEKNCSGIKSPYYLSYSLMYPQKILYKTTDTHELFHQNDSTQGYVYTLKILSSFFNTNEIGIFSCYATHFVFFVFLTLSYLQGKIKVLYEKKLFCTLPPIIMFVDEDLEDFFIEICSNINFEKNKSTCDSFSKRNIRNEEGFLTIFNTKNKKRTLLALLKSYSQDSKKLINKLNKNYAYIDQKSNRFISALSFSPINDFDISINQNTNLKNNISYVIDIVDCNNKKFSANYENICNFFSHINNLYSGHLYISQEEDTAVLNNMFHRTNFSRYKIQKNICRSIYYSILIFMNAYVTWVNNVFANEDIKKISLDIAVYICSTIFTAKKRIFVKQNNAFCVISNFINKKSMHNSFITKREIMKYLNNRFNNSDVEDALCSLIDSGRILKIQPFIKENALGRPSTLYKIN